MNDTLEDKNNKELLQHNINTLENKLTYMQRDLKRLEDIKEELENEINDFDKDASIKIEDIIPTSVKEYQKYKKRLERIKQLKEKAKGHT